VEIEAVNRNTKRRVINIKDEGDTCGIEITVEVDDKPTGKEKTQKQNFDFRETIPRMGGRKMGELSLGEPRAGVTFWKPRSKKGRKKMRGGK